MKTDENGKYTLSDQGKDALNSVETVEKVTESGAKQKQKATKAKTSYVLKLASLALVALSVASCALFAFEHNLVSSLQIEFDEGDAVLNNELIKPEAIIAELSAQVDVFNATITQQGKAVLFLNTALQMAQTIVYMNPPVESRYLTTFSEQNQGILTKIHLVSLTSGYHYMPVFSPLSFSSLVVQTDTGNLTFPSLGWWAMSSDYQWGGSGGDQPTLMI